MKTLLLAEIIPPYMFYAIFRFLLCFFIWDLYIYIIHYLGHIPSKYNPFYIIHREHHSKDYRNGSDKIPALRNFFWIFGSFKGTLDVYIQQTIGALLVVWLDPVYGWPILPFHYFYEIFLGDGVLDHNPEITGPITKYFAIGKYHLRHHSRPNANYSLYFTFLDHLFGTVAPSTEQDKKVAAQVMRDSDDKIHNSLNSKITSFTKERSSY